MANNNNKQYDIIIAGAGAAGLSLAYYLTSDARGKQLRIALLDKEAKTENDRTWGYWSKVEHPFNFLAKHTYKQAEFYSQAYSANINLTPYTYYVIQAAEFYAYVKKHLAKCTNVSWIETEVQKFEDTGEGVEVITPGQVYSAKYVFSSLFLKQQLTQAKKSHLVLNQHFKGWVIETPNHSFDTSTFRMFDFRTPQKGLFRFFYILPYAPNRALVEYTLFSQYLLQPKEYDDALVSYIYNVLNISNYRVVEEEWGEIPMTTYAFPQQSGRTINIGSVGGASKASTGYTFARIQKQCQFLARQVLLGQQIEPFKFGGSRFAHYDDILLNILHKKGDKGEDSFAALFRNNKVADILAFLDEDTSFGQELKIMNGVPAFLFMRSALNYFLGLPF